MALIDQAVERLERIMRKDYDRERRYFRQVKAVKRKLECRSLDLLQTDKSGRFVVLPRSVRRTKGNRRVLIPLLRMNGTTGKH